MSPFPPRGIIPDLSKLRLPSLSGCLLLRECFCTLFPSSAPRLFLWLQGSYFPSMAAPLQRQRIACCPTLAFLSVLHLLFSPLSAFPCPLRLPQHYTGQNSTTISNFQAAPPPCCSILPERAQVLPGGNDCYLQDTLHITSTPFGVFRPSSFCCVSHFAPRACVLKDQGLLFTSEVRQMTGLLEVETFFLLGHQDVT